MKKRTKIIAGVVTLALIGGGIMLNNNYKTNGNIFDFTSREDRQLAYLKEHEQEIIDFVKSLNPKVESVQIDWTQTRWSEGGHTFETKYMINIYGHFNGIDNSGWRVFVFYNKKNGEIDMNSLSQGSDLSIGGEPFE